MLIGLTGLAGAGKSTVARHLAQKYGFLRAPFAYALRQDLLYALQTGDWGDYSPPIAVAHELEALAEAERLEALRIKPTPMWARTLMQDYGAWRRRDDPDYWVKRWEQLFGRTPQSIVIDDVRYNNEARFIRGKLGVVIKLDRDLDACLTSSGMTPEQARHESERGVSDMFVSATMNANVPFGELPRVADEIYEYATRVEKALREQVGV